jgi:CBS domain-containing protein
MRVRQLLSHKKSNEILHARPEFRLLEAAAILSQNNIGALPVIGEDEALLGILSERDLVRSLARDHVRFFEVVVGDIMTTSVITCAPDDDADAIYAKMGEKNIRHIPVVEKDRLFAMLSIRDFENAHKKLREQSLTDEVTGLQNLRHFLSVLDNEFNRYRRFQSPLSVASVHSADYIRAQSRSTLGRAISSAGEHSLHTGGVTGSIPVSPTIFQ